MYRRGDGPLKKRFSKISIHSLGFRIFVLLAVMIVLFCALVAYNNTAAFVLMLERMKIFPARKPTSMFSH